MIELNGRYNAYADGVLQAARNIAAHLDGAAADQPLGGRMTPVQATGFNTGSAQGDLSNLDRRLDHMVSIAAPARKSRRWGLMLSSPAACCRTVLPRSKRSWPAMICLFDACAHCCELDGRGPCRDHAPRRACLDGSGRRNRRQVVVLHPGRVPPKDWVDRSETLYQFEIDQLGPVADRAAEQGIEIAYENISPNPRVISGLETSYSLDPRALAHQLERLGHDAVMACLDISPCPAGRGPVGFDMIEACSALAPWIGHIHSLTAPARRPPFRPGSREEQHFFGVGDMHAPQGLGAVDFETLAHALTVRAGTRVVIEIKRNFLEHAEGDTLAAAKAFGERLRLHPA